MSKRFRFLCPQCGTYQEVKGNGPCWKCPRFNDIVQ